MLGAAGVASRGRTFDEERESLDLIIPTLLPPVVEFRQPQYERGIFGVRTMRRGPSTFIANLLQESPRLSGGILWRINQ